MQQMSCSGRFVAPFLKTVAGRPGGSATLECLDGRESDRRVNVQQALDQIEQWVESIGDPDLGLRAGQQTCLGSGGPLDYALHSAQTLRDSIIIAQRYSRLYSDAIEIQLQIDEDRAVLQLETKLPWPRAVADFVLSAWYRIHLKPHLDRSDDLLCSFAYERPESTALHTEIFNGVGVNFSAGYDGFSFDVRALDRPLASSEPLLHAVHCEHLETQYTRLPDPLTITLRVRQLIAAELRHGRPSSVIIARKLHMSRRTLVRRLEAEGTSFTLELEELRRQLALRFVTMRALPIVEITNLLGFSHVQGFHRAFKRWTGQTPLHYRASAEP